MSTITRFTDAAELVRAIGEGTAHPADLEVTTWGIETTVTGGDTENPIQIAEVVTGHDPEGITLEWATAGETVRRGLMRLTTMSALDVLDAYGEWAIRYSGWTVVARKDDAEVRIDLDELGEEASGRTSSDDFDEFVQAVERVLEDRL